jgi:hypothetical protein
MTQEELEQLIEMWPSHTVAEIAIALSTTRREVTRNAHDLRKRKVAELRDKRRSEVDYEILAKVAREAEK